jgi:hypothetical protein
VLEPCNKIEKKECAAMKSETIDPFYSPSNLTALQESIQQMQQGKTVTKTLEELEAIADD